MYVMSSLQSPEEKVVAIGLADGRTVIHNIEYDETLMTFRQDWGPVTAVCFRTGLYQCYHLTSSSSLLLDRTELVLWLSVSVSVALSLLYIICCVSSIFRSASALAPEA